MAASEHNIIDLDSRIKERKQFISSLIQETTNYIFMII